MRVVVDLPLAVALRWRRIPQCPWSVYSSTQTSVITTSSGAASFIAATACGHRAVRGRGRSRRAASFVFGQAEQEDASQAALLRLFRVAAAAFTGSWKTPGIVPTGRGSSTVALKNRGQRKSRGVEGRLAHEGAEGRGRAQAARAVEGERHGGASTLG